MIRYSSFVGKRVEAQYRVADIHQKSVGTLVIDTGRSVIVEEHLVQGERKKTMRVEIPYEYVIRIVEAPQSSEGPVTVPVAPRKKRR
jgi:sporulation protein YlmC with PRC-barrel domain